MGDVDLVLDGHDLVEVPHEGAGGGEVGVGTVGGGDLEDEVDVAAGVGEIFVLDQVVDAPGEVAAEIVLGRKLGDRSLDQRPIFLREVGAAAAGSPEDVLLVGKDAGVGIRFAEAGDGALDGVGVVREEAAEVEGLAVVAGGGAQAGMDGPFEAGEAEGGGGRAGRRRRAS
ncbi:MAG: hypothetical protein M5U12_07380 [Verrucomicrobia bacterium]|nr:hypothetical protein [Verrucomicrobiota bacterium]